MLLSSRTTMNTTNSPSAGPSSLRPSKPTPKSDSHRRLTEKGKGIGKPWVDGPWPLIETPSRTQHLTTASLHIANELAQAHNAMLRGLNAITLQAPHIQTASDDDITDFLFLTQAWSAWVLDHHVLKETVMIPGFEAALRLQTGSLRTPTTSSCSSDGSESESGDSGVGTREERHAEDIPVFLQDVHAYATSTMSRPESYSAATLQALLAALGSSLVPHLHDQIPILARMQDLRSPFPSSSPLSSNSISISTPSSSSSSLPLSPAQAAAYASRANKLTQTHVSCETALADRADRFVVPPMVTRLRDVTYEGGNGGTWPRLSVPALHAVADRLSPRHAGAWRFLPCDVWGRPRELGFV
ncbi:hypothetical protein GGR53DRAFT_413168 [Hypoxylon sp. FL1150]|nr:hypothetical protein GGR53DRAFT_413168 [Hypoxylon sp. FL1150]